MHVAVKCNVSDHFLGLLKVRSIVGFLLFIRNLLILIFCLFLGSPDVFPNLTLLISNDMVEHFYGIVMAIIDSHSINSALEIKLLGSPFPWRVKLLKLQVQEGEREGIVSLMGYFFSEIVEIKFGLCRRDLYGLVLVRYDFLRVDIPMMGLVILKELRVGLFVWS